MTNADLNIKVSLTVKTRNDGERFRPSTTYTETWALDTTLSAYKTTLPPLLDQVWAYAQAQRTADITAEVGCHYQLRIDNVTAPSPPTGAWVQAKEHFDGALSDGDFTSADSIKNRIYHALDNMIALAKY